MEWITFYGLNKKHLYYFYEFLRYKRNNIELVLDSIEMMPIKCNFLF